MSITEYVPPPKSEKSWLFMVENELFDSNSSFSIISIPHPATNQVAKFCLDDANRKIYEISTYNEDFRSWFIGNIVKSDGRIFMTTPINPIFLILPRLRKECVMKAVPLEDLLSADGFDKFVDFVPSLEVIADLKGPPDLKAYKYNENKTLEWLEKKVRKVAKVLKEKDIRVTSGSVSTTFVTSNIEGDSIDEEFYLQYAHGIVSEYLEEDLSNMLEKQFQFRREIIESISKKRKLEVDNKPTKKIKKEENTDISNNSLENSCSESPKQNVKPVTLSAKQKARQKAANGTKTISSFFKKK